MRRALAVVFATTLAALGAAFAFVPSCSREAADTEQAPAVDTEIMAFLSEARALHHQANLAETAGDLPGAIAAMDRLVSARRPHPERKTPEVEEVLADAYARLAELRLEKGELDPAAGAVKNGLDHVAEPTYFRGHLIEVQGLVEEARAAELADAGKTAESKQARERAIQLLEEVVRIQDQVIQHSLAKDAGSEGGK